MAVQIEANFGGVLSCADQKQWFVEPQNLHCVPKKTSPTFLTVT